MSIPSFFPERRVGLYFKGGRMLKDRKTDQRFWRLKWALTLFEQDARASGGAILSAYRHLNDRKNAADLIELAGCMGGITITAHATEEDDSPAAAEIIQLSRCMIDRLSMTWADGMTELWCHVEHDLTDELHAFVKEYAFTRFWVEFEKDQRSLLDDVGTNAAARFQDIADKTGVTSAISVDGKAVATFKQKGRPN